MSSSIKKLVEQAIAEKLSENYSSDVVNHNQHPEVRDMRSKGYSVYVSKVHSEDPHVVHEVEKDGNEAVVIRHEGDGRYYLRTGPFGGLGSDNYDSLQGAADHAFELAKTGKYPSINKYW